MKDPYHHHPTAYYYQPPPYRLACYYPLPATVRLSPASSNCSTIPAAGIFAAMVFS